MDRSRVQGGEQRGGGDRPAFGALLRHYRVAAGLAQETLAERARISVQAISALERGLRKIPQRQTLTAILGALELDDDGRRRMESAAIRTIAPRSRRNESVISALPERAEPSAHAIPSSLNAFFGRVGELDEAAGLLAQTRLLTVAGPGGMGKTRFALALAERVAGRFEDGVYFVELQPVSDAGLVPSAILEALSLREDPNRPIERTVVDHLSSRSALLVIDNCERVRDGCARIVERLLRACPRLRIVPTTRIVLSVPGETTFRLSSLQENDAVALFCERARAAVPAYELTPDDAGIIAGIVRKLDGIPLAVELAAARTRVMSLQTLDRRLEELMRETAAGGSRTQPTLRAALDWSYEYLSAQERMLFERLAVFAGSLTLEAAESVCGGDGLAAGNILDLLTVLVDNSLVQFERHGEATRFRYLDTVRAYALEKFAVSPARERIRAAHAHWFVSFVEGLEPKLYDAGQLAALEQIGDEIDNVRSALDAALAPGPSPEEALRLTAALWRYWLIRNNLQEGRAALGAVLDRPAAAFPALRARNLIGLGSLHLQLRDFEAAWTCAREACGLAREAGDERSLVHALGVCLIAPSYYADPSDAERDSAELERRTSAMGDRWLAALPLFTNALRALRDADAQGANVFLERARAIVVTLGAPYDIAAVSCQLGFNRLELSDAGGAAEAFFEYVRHGAALNSRDLIGHCTDGLACVAVHTERMADAAELFGAGRAIRELMGGELWSHWRPVHERLRVAAFEALGDERFDERARVGYELARRDPFLPMRRFESAYGMPGGTTCATMALRTPEDVLPEVVPPEVAPVFSKSPL